jgi:serine/threonine protein kinase
MSLETPPLEAPLLLGRYQPLTLLARGGSALVYLGRDEHLERDVAIKLFIAGGTGEFARFRDELRVLASLSHHGVVSVLDAGIDESLPSDPRPFLVLELVRGDSLRTLLQAGELTQLRVGEIGFEVAEALEYVHARGVIHRDITPANVMLVDYGTTFSRPRARLTDFGIALDSSTVPTAGSPTEGTAAYLSPEQARFEPVTPAADIYSLGLVLLEGFTGERAFPGTAIESALARLENDPPMPDSVPPGWRPLLKAMTERDPAQRPTAAEVAVAARRELRATARHKKKKN